MEKRASLQYALDHVRSRIDLFNREASPDGVGRSPGPADALIVPTMFWELEHTYDELNGKSVNSAEPRVPILEAWQRIHLRLDRSGAALESSAGMAFGAVARVYVFNRPFLVYMKKHERRQPFFVMWVDNAELLNKK